MNIELEDENIILRNIDFNLENTFECGQCFRWNKSHDGVYKGVALDRFLKIGQKEDGSVTLYNTDIDDFNNIWYNYFDLSKDYSKIEVLCETDEIFAKAYKMYGGLRILKQDPWECIVSFIISANNRISQIKKVIERLSSKYGKTLSYEGNEYFGFPSADALKDATESELRDTKCGFRAKYIKKAADMASQLDLDSLYDVDIDEARSILKTIPGIGDKVADCILLFAYGKMEAFPVDVWVKRVLVELYGYSNGNIENIREFARKKFGQFPGLAQQYLFYYMRENLGGV